MKTRQIDRDLLRLREIADAVTPTVTSARDEARRVLVDVDDAMARGLPEREIKKVYRATLEEIQVPPHVVDGLDLYAENTRELRPQFDSIIANLKKKVESRRYDAALAWKLWLHWYNAAVSLLGRYQGTARARFTPAARRVAAKQRAAEEYEKILGGEYGDLRMKPEKAKRRTR